MNLDLLDRTRWDATEVGGLYVHIVEGVCPSSIHDAWAKVFPNKECPHDRVAPPEWVALSEQKCETCGGDKFWLDSDREEPVSCGDCLGSGRPLVQVTVPCDPALDPIDVCQEMLLLAHRFDAEELVRSGWNPPRVSIGSVTVEAVAPIVGVQEQAPGFECIEIVKHGPTDRTALLWFMDGGRMRSRFIDLGPNPEQYVGKFGVIVRRLA